MESDFPHARSLLAVRSWRGHKNDLGKPQIRYYISSRSPEQATHQSWADLIRGHWGGVEIRNHWRRDACLFEDRTRSKNPQIVANLALLRNALLKIIEDHKPANSNLPAFSEMIASHSKLAYRFISRKASP